MKDQGAKSGVATLLNIVLNFVVIGLAALYIKVTWGWFVAPLTDISAPPWAYILGILAMLSFVKLLSTSDLYLLEKKKVDAASLLAYTMSRMFSHLVSFVFAVFVYALLI